METSEIKKSIIEKIKLKTNFELVYGQIQINLVEGKITTDEFFELINLFFMSSHVYQEKTEKLLKFYLVGRLGIQTISDNIISDDIIFDNLKNAVNVIDFFLMIFLLVKPKILCNNNDEIIQHNIQVHKNLDRLINFCTINNTFAIDSADKFKNVLLINYSYYHVYNGLNNKELFIKLAKLWKLLCPDLTYKTKFTQPIISEISNTNKIKIGFASGFLQLNQSVCRDRIGIISSLINDERFEVYLITTTKTEESIYNVVINSTGFKNKIIINESIEEARKVISNLNLNILVYPEIQMDLFFYLLAFSRLAPIQINTWGHSETSGIDTIDYFMSSKYYEQEDGNKFYSENLIKLDSLCTYYYSLRIFDFSQNVRNLTQEQLRVEKNLPKTGIIYGMFQTVFKYQPETLQIIKEILYQDPKAIIIMLTYDELGERFIDYLDKNLGYHSNRVRIFPRTNLHEYTKLIKCVDIVLDSYPFGGCNSSLEAFYLNKVVITMPANKINGRFTYGFYLKMGILEPVCYNQNEFVTKAIFYANNKTELKKLESAIAENAEKLFEENASVITWKEQLFNLIYNHK